MTTATHKLPGGSGYLAVAALGFLIAGALVVYALMSQGHSAFNTNNDGMYWGLPIVVYDFFLLSSTGLAMVAGLGLALGQKEFLPVAKRCLWLALAAMAGAGATLFLELGAPLRAMYAIPFSFAVASPLFWKVILVIVYAVTLLMLVARINSAKTEELQGGLAKIMVAAALGVTLVAGSVFGMLAMKPFWFGGELPIAFLVESFLGAMAFVYFFTLIGYGGGQNMPDGLRGLFAGKMADLFALVIVLHAAFVGTRVITGLWSNADGLEVWHHIAGSALFHVEIWLGIALPLVLMLGAGTRTQPKMQLLAAALTLVGLFIARYEFIIGGQMVAPFKGAWVPGLIQYTPSMTEWALLVMAVALANAVYAFGESRMKLDD